MLSWGTSDAQRVQDYVRAVPERKRAAVPARSFVFNVRPRDPHPYINYAIPLPGATQGDGRTVIDAAHARGRSSSASACSPLPPRS